MAKTLKDFLEGYLKVKSADEQKFIDKHVTAKNPDRNGNGDDVFKGNTKPIDRRKERKGYNPGEDEKVYEELKGNQHKIDANKNGKIDAEDFKHLRKKKKVVEAADDPKLAFQLHMAKKKEELRKKGQLAKEEAEQIDELSTSTLQSYRKKARAQGNAIVDKMKMGGGDWSKDQKDTKTLRKRAAGANMSGKQLVKRGESLKTEEAEQIDELSKATLGSYVKKAKTQMSRSDTVAGRLAGERMKGGKPSAQERKHNERANKRYFGIDKAVDRLTKEDVVREAAGKYGCKTDKPKMRKEEKLANMIADLSESHQRTMMGVFEKLNDENKSKFLEACDTPEGVEQMLDFAINNRGE